MKDAKWVGYLPFCLLTAIVFICLAVGLSSAVTTAAQNTPVSRSNTLIIDAGHGGVDGGATSCTGVLESQLNLQIALRLNDMLCLLGHKTRMIRTTDISVYTQGETIAAKKISDLKERVRIVNETDNAVLISIHQNTFSDSRYSGPQVFYSAASDSLSLAQSLQSALIQTFDPTSRRTVKKASGVYLLEHIHAPGVLVECGFLSNPEEEARLRSPDYQKTFCAVLAVTVSSFLSNT